MHQGKSKPDVRNPFPFTIRPARVHEIDALTKFFHLHTKPLAILVAGLPERRRPAGAAAMWPPASQVLHPGLRFKLFVLPEFRRRGVGSALLRSLITSAEMTGAKGLFTAQPQPAGPASRLLSAFGFQAVRRKLFFSCPLKSALDSLAPLARRPAAMSGRLAGAEILSLEHVDAREVAQLHKACLGGFSLPEDELFSLDGAHAFHRSSPALMAGGRAMGAVLGRVTGDVATIDAYMVHPEVRRTRAAALLLSRAAQLARSMNLERIEFNCYEDVSDTVKLAARLKTEPGRILTHYLLGLSQNGGSVR